MQTIPPSTISTETQTPTMIMIRKKMATEAEDKNVNDAAFMEMIREFPDFLRSIIKSIQNSKH